MKDLELRETSLIATASKIEKESLDIEYSNTTGLSYPCDLCDFEGESELEFNHHQENLHITSKNILFADNSNIRLTNTVGAVEINPDVPTSSPIENIQIYKPKEKNHEIEHIIPFPDGNGGLKYPCNKCPYISSTKNTLKRHLDFTHKKLKCICEECNKVYLSITSLRRHRAIAHRGKMFSCEECNYQCKSSDSFKNHKLKSHQ